MNGMYRFHMYDHVLVSSKPFTLSYSLALIIATHVAKVKVSKLKVN